MSRTLSNIPGSDSPLKAHLVAKAVLSNAKLTRKENHRELRRDMMNVSLVAEPDKFLELFLPLPAPPRGKKARRAKPSNPFANMEKPTTEKMMYEDYPKRLNKIIRGSGCAFVATPYKADDATDPRLAVDCGMYPRNRMPTKDLTKGMDAAKKKDFRRVCWSGIDLPAECKLEDDPFDDTVDTGRPHNEKRKDASGQALSYIELTYHHQHRTFVFMLIFIGLNCRLLRVDRSGLFVTKRFDITKTDFLVEFLQRYVKLSPEARGFDTTAEYIDPVQDELAGMMKERLAEVEQALEEQKALEAGDANMDGEGEDRVEEHVVKLWRDALDEKWPWWKLRVPDEVTKKDRWFLVGKPSFQAPGVRGRGTRCYIALEIFERGKNEHVLDTKFVHLKDCWRVVADNTSDRAMDIRKEGETLGKLNGAKVERVPTLVAHGDLADQNTSASPEAWKTVNDKFKCRLKTHRHYRLVVEEIGKPLSDFTSSGELVVALYDCIQGASHHQAMAVKIIHRDISGGNILLYRKKGESEWHGLLTDWELSKDSEVFPVARQAGRTGTLQFSAARVLDDPSKPIVVADELECFFHVLIYYSVRFLRHNLPDKSVGIFLNNYFDASSGQTQNGELTAPALKRRSMEIGRINLKEFGVADALQFMWVDDEPAQVAHPTSSTVTQDPDFAHPLNKLVGTLLSWFSALYTLENLGKPSSSSTPSQPRKGGKLIVLGKKGRTGATAPAVDEEPTQPSPEELAKLTRRAEKLDNQMNVLALIEEIAAQPFPQKDKGRDKRPEKGYSPCSPETPQFSEVSDFPDPEAESDEEVADGSTAVPNAPAPAAFAKLAARIDDGDAVRRAAMVTSMIAEDVEFDDGPGPRTPSPCPSRPKRGREDDTKPETLGKRSRY
ncbi:hypothetical protein GSI_04056 [Ganoderma sinense ZZ0214-1]|uniref:Fungal-type protein kinase domain-containing protein n=1 Tax=Ganoderma sinense ZZ0214-1 TaxID=1077348 RepID=A0A2G8SI34_9APHY|nr:hypothetical protein GSI_04056 [Ganoderma sinense ZZ0214-1]